MPNKPRRFSRFCGGCWFGELFYEFYWKSKAALYTLHCIGDGDSKAHNEVVKNDPYPGIVVEKECVGQKRLGSCLRNLKGPLTDGKTLGLSFA